MRGVPLGLGTLAQVVLRTYAIVSIGKTLFGSVSELRASTSVVDCLFVYLSQLEIIICMLIEMFFIFLI